MWHALHIVQQQSNQAGNEPIAYFLFPTGTNPNLIQFHI